MRPRNRGACHLRGYTVASEVLGIPVKTDPLTTEGKAGLVKAFQDATAVFDCGRHLHLHQLRLALADVAPQIQAACEGDWSLENLSLVGERIWNMEREFNIAAGFTTGRRQPAAAAADRAGQDRPGQGPGQRPGQDAARVLRDCAAGTRTACRRPRRARAWACRAAGPSGDKTRFPPLRRGRARRGMARSAVYALRLERPSRTALAHCESMSMKHLILGAGPAGVIAAETLRKAAPEDEICSSATSPSRPIRAWRFPTC